jgi:hypothetical protein
MALAMGIPGGPAHLAARTDAVWYPHTAMTGFVALVLICQISVPQEDCTEVTARDVMSIHVDSELGCTSGWQDVIARSAFAQDIGKTAYIKTLCRRASDKARSDR